VTAFGTTFVFSTHDPRVVSQAEVVFRLEDGRLVSQEPAGAAAVNTLIKIAVRNLSDTGAVPC
jgi:ABC-type lipoprotein export system ATPase subunit